LTPIGLGDRLTKSISRAIQRRVAPPPHHVPGQVVGGAVADPGEGAFVLQDQRLDDWLELDAPQRIALTPQARM